MATRDGGGATQRHSLSTCQPDGAPVLLEERRRDGDKTPGCAAGGLEIVFCLFVGYEENQAQELAVDAPLDMFYERRGLCGWALI